jgi:Mrp family chromosome partitioning ATPase/capsular polysaccharide biosynthesis protein
VTLRDYLRVLREQRLLIVLVTLAFGGAAFAWSARQQPVYQAEASLAYQDSNQDLQLFGEAGVPALAPDQRAFVNAKLVTRPAVVQRVRRALKTTLPAATLQGAVSTRVEARTNLVVVVVDSSDARFAQRLANAFATQAAAVTNEQARRQIARAADTFRRNFRRLRRSTDPVARTLQAQRLAQLETLESVTRPASVARYAEAPAAPISPRPIRNTILGLLVGLTLGILAAFIRDSLDVRLRGAREIQNEMGFPLLGHVGRESLGNAGISVNGRAAVAAPELESFRILRTNLEFLDVDHPPKTILVTSALPEEGKSTVAASLAAATALSGRRTLLVECDLRRPSLAGRLGLKDRPGLSDFLAGKAGPRDIVQALPIAAGMPTNGHRRRNGKANGNGHASDGDHDASLVCITAGAPTPRPAETLGSERFREFLEQVREAYDIVILDSSPMLPVVDTLEVLPRVDGVLVCVRAGRTTREQARAAKAAIEHFPPRPTGLVVTGVRGDEAAYGYYYGSPDREPAERAPAA